MKYTIGSRENPLVLKTPPNTAAYSMHSDTKDGKDILVCTVGKTILHYDYRCLDDLRAMLQTHGDWMELGSADEQKPAKDNTVEAWGRSPKNPFGGFYGLKKGLRGRFAMYIPPLMEALGLAELTHEPKGNKMRAKYPPTRSLMKIKTIWVLLLVGCFAVDTQAQIPMVNTDSVRNKWKDLAYASNSPAQKLDIYLPDNGDGPFPVIIAIHGGAFMIGDKADFQLKPMLEGLKRGYAVVSINYRMVGEATAPKLIFDVKAAIRWVRANGSKYKLNTTRIAVWGSSAGGYLSALAGTSGDVKEMEDLTMGNAKESSRVQAVVDWFGPINFLTMDDQFYMLGVKGMPHSNPNSPESKVIGKNIAEAEPEVKAFNPETYMSKDDPPFFIEHGSKDPLIPYLQSTEFSNALYKVLGKEKVNFEILEGAGHGTQQFSTPANLDRVFLFLDKYLKGNVQ